MFSQVSAAPAGGASPGSPEFTAALRNTWLLFCRPALLSRRSAFRASVARASPLLLFGRPGPPRRFSFPPFPQRFHMRLSTVLQAGCFLALAGLAGCGDQPATEPTGVVPPVFAKKSSDNEVTRVGHRMLTRINTRLAAAHSKVRVGKAEVLYKGKVANAQSPTVDLHQ